MSRKFQKFIDKIRQEFCLKKLELKGFYISRQKQTTESKRILNVIIPCIEKDAKLLPLVICSIRKFLKHPINSINIVAPQGSTFIKEFCNKNDCNFINETDVLDRNIIASGWYYQQFIKWAWADYKNEHDYVSLDADTIFLEDFSYDYNDRIILEYDETHHKPYRNLIRAIGFDIETSLGFVCHHMLWKRDWLAELKEKIEERNNCSWIDAIKNNVTPEETIKFSEFQTYGNFLVGYHRDDILLEDWKNTTQQYLKEYDLNNPEDTLNLLVNKFKNNKSVTFPSWYMNNYKNINNL